VKAAAERRTRGAELLLEERELLTPYIANADAVTTVSPTYASEILTTEYGCGLDGLLRERAADITGVLNGADYGLWDPSSDPYIRRNYTARSVAPKRTGKRAIQSELGLCPNAEPPARVYEPTRAPKNARRAPRGPAYSSRV